MCSRSSLPLLRSSAPGTVQSKPLLASAVVQRVVSARKRRTLHRSSLMRAASASADSRFTCRCFSPRCRFPEAISRDGGFSEAFVDSFNNPVPERTMAALFGSTEATEGWKGAGARLLATVPTLLDGVGSAGCLLDAPSSDRSITDPTTGPFITGCMRPQSSVWSGGRLK